MLNVSLLDYHRVAARDIHTLSIPLEISGACGSPNDIFIDFNGASLCLRRHESTPLFADHACTLYERMVHLNSETIIG